MARVTRRRALDIGCGAGRNSVPLAALGWDVLGVDLSPPMVRAAIDRKHREAPDAGAEFALAAMDRLPLADRSCDLIVAHGIWNLARTGSEFRGAVREAGRVAATGAALFVFTFSRSTLAATATPLAGESFVFTPIPDHPQCFLTGPQLVAELGAAGFVPDPAAPLRELNPRVPGMLVAVGSPVIWEGAFRYRAEQ
jgi:2-polyprenyl-6-hydroxyphenyl methylase/3-demethylubiquinone-9 3-methyltransferase